MLVPSAWEAPYDGPFLQFSVSRAIDNTIYVVTCNHTGQSEQLNFFGKSSIFGPDGQAIVTAEKPYELITAIADSTRRNELKQSFFSMLEERRTDVYS